MSLKQLIIYITSIVTIVGFIFIYILLHPSPIIPIVVNASQIHIESHLNSDEIDIYSDQCKNALLAKYDIRSLPTDDNEMYLWSRESLDAYSKGKSFEPIFATWWIKKFKTIWIRVIKSGSTSIQWRLQTMPEIAMHEHPADPPSDQYWNTSTMTLLMNKDRLLSEFYQDEYIKEMLETRKCMFVFVRNPVKRFISAYYHTNVFLYNHMGHSIEPPMNEQDALERNLEIKNVITMESIKHLHSFWSELGEPQRVVKFIENMWNNPYEFMHSKTVFPHSATQVGWFLGNAIGRYINFIGKVENFDADWQRLKEKCGLEDSEDEEIKNAASGVHQLFDSWYWRKKGKQINLYAKMMGIEFKPRQLNVSFWKNNHDKIKWKDYLAPAYFVIANNETLYNKIVEYYWQDFVCLKYEINFESFRNSVLSKKNINQIVFDYPEGVKNFSKLFREV